VCDTRAQALRKRAAEEGVEVVVVSAKVEAELNELPKEEVSARRTVHISRVTF
jgi:hypothetical protein